MRTFPRRIERRNDRAGHLDPDGRALLDEFDFLLRGREAATDGLDVAEKRGAVQNGFEPLAEDVHRMREDFVQCLVGQKDVVVSVDDQHRFTETAERRLELRQLPAAELLEMVHLLDQLVGSVAHLVPRLSERSGVILTQQRLLREDRLLQQPQGGGVAPQAQQRPEERRAEDDDENDKHAKRCGRVCGRGRADAIHGS